MAQYATVTWQPGDEVTSTKLHQMAQNEEWLKSVIVTGNLNFFANAQGTVAAGRQAGILPATKLEAVQFSFDSQVPVGHYDFFVPYPPVFTQAPIAAVSIATVNNQIFGSWVTDQTPSGCTYRIMDVQRMTVRMQGTLNVILFGV